MTAASSAAPYRAAAFTLTVDGVDHSSATSSRLRSLTLAEKRGGEADQLDIVLSDHDGRLAIPKRDGKVTLSLGWREAAGATGSQPDPAQALVSKGAFIIDEVEYTGAPDEITVRARSADFTSELRVRAERSWRDTTLGAVLRDIAGRHGLQASIAAGLADIRVPVLQQSRQSDGALLERLGHLYDAAATVKAGRLIFAPIGSGRTASGGALPTALTLTRRDGDQHRWTLPQRDQYEGVTASWHDKGAAKRRTVTAGGGSSHKHLRRVFATEADAKQAAGGEWGRVQRAAATMSYALALGRPDLYPERRVRLSGFKPQIDATSWLVSAATHNLTDSEGLSTALELEAAP